MSMVDVSILILATMVAVLAGMVGYMYWQQSRVLQAVNSLSAFISSQFIPQPALDVEDEDSDEDDRQTVEQEVEVVEAVVPPVEDDLKTKSSADLRDLLSKKGIPYGKRDSKATLLELLKASN
jgi:flagellar basal body-associated protein FliL